MRILFSKAPFFCIIFLILFSVFLVTPTLSFLFLFFDFNSAGVGLVMEPLAPNLSPIQGSLSVGDTIIDIEDEAQPSSLNQGMIVEAEVHRPNSTQLQNTLGEEIRLLSETERELARVRHSFQRELNEVSELLGVYRSLSVPPKPPRPSEFCNSTFIIGKADRLSQGSQPQVQPSQLHVPVSQSNTNSCQIPTSQPHVQFPQSYVPESHVHFQVPESQVPVSQPNAGAHNQVEPSHLNVGERSSVQAAAQTPHVVVVRDRDISTYSGGPDLSQWRVEAESLLKDLNLGQEQGALKLLQFLSGDARKEVMATPLALSSTSEFFKTLESAFGVRESSFNLKTRFFTRVQNERETIQNFATDLKFLFHSICQESPDFVFDHRTRSETLNARFLDGLRDGSVVSQLELVRKFKPDISFEEFRDEAIRITGQLNRRSGVEQRQLLLSQRQFHSFDKFRPSFQSNRTQGPARFQSQGTHQTRFPFQGRNAQQRFENRGYPWSNGQYQNQGHFRPRFPQQQQRDPGNLCAPSQRSQQ